MDGLSWPLAADGVSGFRSSGSIEPHFHDLAATTTSARSRHLVGEPRHAPTITTNTIVGEVAPHHCRQVAMLVTDGQMPVFPTPVVHRGQRTGKPAFGRDLPNHGLAFP